MAYLKIEIVSTLWKSLEIRLPSPLNLASSTDLLRKKKIHTRYGVNSTFILQDEKWQCVYVTSELRCTHRDFTTKGG